MRSSFKRIFLKSKLNYKNHGEKFQLVNLIIHIIYQAFLKIIRIISLPIFLPKDQGSVILNFPSQAFQRKIELKLHGINISSSLVKQILQSL